MSWIGGGGDDNEGAEKQYEFDVSKWEHQSAAQETRYIEDVFLAEMQKQHIEKTALQQEAIAAQQWDYGMEVRQAGFNSKVAAYNKAEDLFTAQIGLNQRAAMLASEQTRNLNRERQEKLALDSAKANVAFQKSGQDIQFKQQALELDVTQRTSQGRLKAEELNLTRQAERAKAAVDSVDLFTQELQARGKVRARGQAGRSADKAYQAVVAEAGRARAAQVDNITRADSAYNLAMYGLDQDLGFIQNNYQVGKERLLSDKDALETNYEIQQEGEELSKQSIMRAYDQSINKINFDQFSANVKADAKRLTKPDLDSIPIPPKPLEVIRAQVFTRKKPDALPEPIEGAYYGGGGGGGGGNAIVGAIGGAMQGAALGAQLGGGVGAGIGAVLGGAGGAMGIL